MNNPVHGLRGYEVPVNEIVSMSIAQQVPDLTIQLFQDRRAVPYRSYAFDCLGSALLESLQDAEIGPLSRTAVVRARTGAQVGWIDVTVTVFRA